MLRVKAVFFVLVLAGGCGGPAFLTAVEGDPPEVHQLLEAKGYRQDPRVASVRTAAAFFEALDSGDGDRVWYLLDLRAAATWQALQDERGLPEASPRTIVQLLRPFFPKRTPKEIERVAYDERDRTALVRATWPGGAERQMNMAFSSSGWRIVAAPPNHELVAVGRDDHPSETAAPPKPEDDEKAPSRGRQRRPPPGGGIGF